MYNGKHCYLEEKSWPKGYEYLKEKALVICPSFANVLSHQCFLLYGTEKPLFVVVI